jgi:hypothetical protein
MSGQSKKRMSLGLALGLLSLACAACGNTPTKIETSGAVAAQALAIPEEESAAAKAALGSDAEVLLYGALGGTGTQQVVAINRLRSAPSTAETGAPTMGTNVTGTDVARVSILNKEKGLNKDNGTWSEVLRCDEYLKNPKGYLRGTPAVPVAGWRLEMEQQTDKGRVLHFTPLAPPAAVKYGPVALAWNPQAKRYQTLDRNGRQFLGEVSALEMPKARLN